MVPQLPRLLIEAIRERHRVSAGQLVDPVFVVGRVTCIEVLIEKDEEEEKEEEDEEEGKGSMGKRRNYMYSYRMELIDNSGEKITGVLRPGLHETASEEAFTQGVRIKLTGWRVRETVTRGGKEVMFLDLEEFEVMGAEEEEGDDEDEAMVENIGSSVDILSASSLDCASKRSVTASTTSTAREVGEQLRNESQGRQEEDVGSSVDISASSLDYASKRSVTADTTSTAREVEEQLRSESGWGQGNQGEVVERSSPTLAHKVQPGDGIPTLGKSQDSEENYDYGADYLLAIGSFSTPPLPGAQVSLAPETTLPESTQKSGFDTPSQTEKLSDGKPIALSALGKRFLDHQKSSQESVSPLSSSSPVPPAAKKPRIAGDNNSASITPTGPTDRTGPPGIQYPSLGPTAVFSQLSIPPYISPHTPASAFSSAAAVHTNRVETPTNIWSLLRPCPLAELPSRAHGSKVDILAIIYSIDTHLITRNKSVKRDCHLVDPTSPPLVPAPTQPHLKQPHHNELKPVILSVWVKPQSFIPRVGTLVAFRGLTVHRYAGRSLNAFSDVAGSVWYLENPGSEIEGAEEMGEWWADRCMREVAEELERKEEKVKRERGMDGERKEEKVKRERGMDGERWE